MKRAVLVVLALLLANAAPAQDMQSPQIVAAQVDWKAAAATLPGAPAEPAPAFATLNAVADKRFPGIGQTPVPVLLPFDVDGFAKELAASGDQPAVAEAAADRYVRGGFHASKFFLTGPAGYDTAFALRAGEVKELSDIRYADPVFVLFSGLRFTYQLDGPGLPEGEPVKELQDEFPGIRRYLHESYVRYAFERYGVTYVAAVYCLDTRPRAKILTCKQADRIALRFLQALKLVGGAPAPTPAPVAAAVPERPKDVSKDYTYFSPGFLIPGTGLKKDLGGRPDYTVYAHLRFPLKNAPDFANSQSFNNWGDCDFTGRSPRRLGKKRMPYSCSVNGLPLVFDEAAGANYSYPWRDNFCEHRNFYVGQCPGGEGHQGQDIRPSSCTQFNEGADRCQPYQHPVVAAHDGVILRARKQEAVYLFVNTPDTHVRVRYMHMNPNQLDADGVVSGKVVHEGELLGTVGNYNNGERGTTYHLHFDMQVPTKVGWVFVNPYMTLVSAYERLIGARGTEIKNGDAVPPLATVPPVIQHPEPVPGEMPVPMPAAAALGSPAPAAENTAVEAKPHKEVHKARPHKKKRRHVRRRRKHDEDDDG